MNTYTITARHAASKRVALTRQEQGAAALIARAESLEETARILREQAKQLMEMANRRFDHVAH